MVAESWHRRLVRDFAARCKVVNTVGEELAPFSITKARGVVLQSQKYKKQIATDLRKYVVARRGQFAFDPMSLYYGAIGLVRAADIGLVSPDYVVFEADSSVDHDFLDYLLRSPEQVARYESVAETGNQFGKRRRVYWSVFEELAFLLPPLAEQRKIAAILSSVHDAIEASRAVIDQLQVVKKAMMAELLTKGLPGRHKKFKQTELGQVPEEWEVMPLGELLEGIDGGWSPLCEAGPAGQDDWGVLKVSAASWGEFRQDENKRLPGALAPRPGLEVKAGDLIVSRANTPELVGRSVLVRQTRPRLMLSDKLLRLRPRSQSADPAYLNLVLSTPQARAQIEDGATGTSRSMRNISQEKLRAVVVPAPPTSEQREIAMIIDVCSERISEEGKCLVGLAQLKSALMSVLLTGEVRVRVDEEAAA